MRRLIRSPSSTASCPWRDGWRDSSTGEDQMVAVSGREDYLIDHAIGHEARDPSSYAALALSVNRNRGTDARLHPDLLSCTLPLASAVRLRPRLRSPSWMLDLWHAWGRLGSYGRHDALPSDSTTTPSSRQLRFCCDKFAALRSDAPAARAMDSASSSASNGVCPWYPTNCNHWWRGCNASPYSSQQIYVQVVEHWSAF